MGDTIVLWKVKGYTGIQLTKEKLESKKYSFDEIKDSDSNFIKQIEENLEKGGIVFCLLKKKNIKAAYLFKMTKKGKEKSLVFDKKIALDEVNRCIEEFENDIDKVLSGILFNRHDIDKALWREKEITGNKKIKSDIKQVKVFAWFSIVILFMLSLATITLGSIYSMTCISSNSIDEIQKDETIINYVSDINNYDHFEITEAMSEYEEQLGFAIWEIIIPTFFQLLGYILMIVSLKEILDLLQNVTNNKMLFTGEKNKLVTNILLHILIASFFIIKNLLIWFVIVIIIEIIQYLFNYCVCLTNDK